ncbi:hypothetical protein V6N12_056040 [Hibiscus sabdariffa]|uniref:Uncharacterized protein n=1 Tax=Hibiscus sabdariffa TaxID=183260 RepID=A0ABR2CRS1_9ROSI
MKNLANRAVEVHEMSRVRHTELELNDRLKARSKADSGHNGSHVDRSIYYRSTNRRRESEVTMDEEIDEFLQSRVKHGQGSIGSRMDETGPYLPTDSEFPGKLPTTSIGMEHHAKLGPEKPSSLRQDESFFNSEPHEHRKKKEKDHLERSDKKHSRKHKSKEKR